MRQTMRCGGHAQTATGETNRNFNPIDTRPLHTLL